jgi:hypothetical protein
MGSAMVKNNENRLVLLMIFAGNPVYYPLSLKTLKFLYNSCKNHQFTDARKGRFLLTLNLPMV